MMNELIKKFESGEIDVFELLESVKEVEYRLDGHGKFKNVTLKFKDGDLNSFYGVYPSKYSETIEPSEKTLQTIAEIYSKRLEFLGGIKMLGNTLEALEALGLTAEDLHRDNVKAALAEALADYREEE